MKTGIKNRVIGNFLLLVVIAVVFFEAILLWGIHRLFYNTVENALITRLDYSIDYYNKYYYSMTLSDVILEDIDIFWNHTACEVQIFSDEGELLMDSIGVWEIGNTPKDVREALNYGKGVLVESPSYTHEETMAVSKPIIKNGKNFLVLRFITNLDSVNNTVDSINRLVIAIGTATIILTFIVGYFLAVSIVEPLEKLTLSAERMAKGEKPDFEIKKQDEIGKLAGTLQYMAEELKKKEEIKNDFISSISHELRTPLTAIKGWASTLRDFPDEEMLSEGLEIIESESDRLTDMVEELLDFSHYVSGRITLDLDLTDINQLIDKTVREITPRADNFGITLKTEIKDSPLMLNIDSGRIRQVLINVLDNAIKFSNEGGIVEIKSVEEPEVVEISVIDHGAGIAEDEINQVKEKFYKGNSRNSHNGLGLSISDEIMKLHKGNLSVSSELGKWTIVKIILPKEVCNEEN